MVELDPDLRRPPRRPARCRTRAGPVPRRGAAPALRRRAALAAGTALAALATALPAALHAQQPSAQQPSAAELSPAQRQVWERETTYWKLWKAADVEGFMALWDPHLADWPHATASPVDRVALRGMVEKQFAFIRAGTFDYELHPLSVTVLDDVAVTFYTVHTIYRAADGTESSGDSRLTHTWLRTDGSWRIVGGMSAPPPAGGGSGGG